MILGLVLSVLAGNAEPRKFTNIVCFVKFADQPDWTPDYAKYEKLFNDNTAGANSVVNYFHDMSYGKMEWSSTIIPVVYTDKHKKAYFQEESASNSLGYSYLDLLLNTRTNTLVKDMCAAIESQLPEGLLLDGNNDGRVDNVTVIICGDSESSSSYMLWPQNNVVSTAWLNGVQCKNYLMVFDGANGYKTTAYAKEPQPLSTGILCHEMMHTLNAYDLYTSAKPHLNPVYVWDLMSDNQQVPQSLSAHVRATYGAAYGDWIPESDIVEIISEGTYTLKPLTSSSSDGVVYKVYPDKTKSEYFLMEYRDKSNQWDASLPYGGVLVYRVNPGMHGNTGASDKYEMYVFRPYGSTSVVGTVGKAPLGEETGRTSFGTANDADYPFYSDGSRANFSVSNVKKCTEGMSFDIKFNSSAVSEIEIDTLDGSEQIFTLQGIQIKEVSVPGIYIVNGRKVYLH